MEFQGAQQLLSRGIESVKERKALGKSPLSFSWYLQMAGVLALIGVGLYTAFNT